MKKHFDLILVLLAIVIGSLIRIVPLIDKIFHNGFIVFSGPDSYYHMMKVKELLTSSNEISLGTCSFYDIFIASIVWVVSLGLPTIELAEKVAVFISPLLAAGVIIIVYFIGKLLFNRVVGIISAFLIAIIPGEFLGRSFLGVVDHHVAEVLISSLFVLLFIVTLKRWTEKKDIKLMLMPLCFSIIGFIIFIYLWPGGLKLSYISQFLTPTKPLTSETMSGLYSSVIFLHIIITLIITIILVVSEEHKIKYFILVWVIVAILLTIWQIRFDYYLAIPLSILLSYTVMKVYYFTRQISKKAVIIGMIPILALISLIMAPLTDIGNQEFNTPSNNWQESLIWVNENTPEESEIVTWWDSGYWIQYIAERATLCDNSQHLNSVKQSARLLLYGENTLERVNSKSIYLIVDKELVDNKMVVMGKWLERDIIRSNTFAYKLYYGENYKGYKLVYQNDTIKIYCMEAL